MYRKFAILLSSPLLQIDALVPPGPPAVVAEEDASGTAAAHVRIWHPAAAAVLLRLAAAPGTAAGERAAVLGLLGLLCESASLAQQAQQNNKDMLMSAPCCWQQQLLDCLHLASAGAGNSSSGTSGGRGPQQDDAAGAAVAAAAYRLLVLLLARGIAASPHGAQQLEVLVSLLKGQPERRYRCPDTGASSPAAAAPPISTLDSWQLLQGLLADMTLELLAAQAADAAVAVGGAGTSPTAGGRRSSSDWMIVSQVKAC